MTPWAEWAGVRSPTRRGRRSSHCCRQWCNAVDAGEIIAKSSMRSCGSCAPEHPGETSQNATGPGRRHTSGCGSGPRMGPGSESWPRSSSRTTPSVASMRPPPSSSASTPPTSGPTSTQPVPGKKGLRTLDRGPRHRRGMPGTLPRRTDVQAAPGRRRSRVTARGDPHSWSGRGRPRSCCRC